MVRWKALIVPAAAVITIASARAPAQDARVPSRKAVAVVMESNEQIVADFFNRKERAEKAQRAILQGLRQELDQKRAEFEDARKRFDEARNRYEAIIGPLPKQGVMHPADPRLPYEFDMRRLGPEMPTAKPSYISQRPAESPTK